MSRYIDADALKAYMQDKYVLFDNTLADIDAQPTVDVEPVRHGRWVEHHEPYTWMGYAYWTCSECNYGEENENGIRSNYCPICGAKMDDESSPKMLFKGVPYCDVCTNSDRCEVEQGEDCPLGLIIK